MKLAINCLSINKKSALGVRTFLLSHLRQLPVISQGLADELELLFIVQGQGGLSTDIASTLRGVSTRVRVHILEVSGCSHSIMRVLYEQCVLPMRVRSFDTIYSINNANPLFLLGKSRSIITIHDLLPFKASARYGQLQKAYLRFFTKLCARRAKRVFTVSHFTKSEINELLAVTFEKISVFYNCLPYPFAEQKQDAEKYFLVVGGLNADKRVDLSLRGLSEFLRRNPESEVRMLIAGPDQGAQRQLEELVEVLGLSHAVSFLGQVSEVEKNQLLADCIAVTMMGRSEGFGIPVLEAMRFGKPSLVADAGALPEVAGKAGVVVKSPEDSGQVADGMQAIFEPRADWAALCRAEYARFGVSEASHAFWMELLQQQNLNG